MTKTEMKQKIREYLTSLDEGKAAYRRADALLEELTPKMVVDAPIDLGAGQSAQLVDNFAEKSKVWKPCGVSRWDIKVTHAAKPATP